MNGLETLLHSCHEILLFSFKEEHISDPQNSLGAFVLSHFSRVRLFATPWTVARQAPLSMGFSRQEYWNGLPFPSAGHLPHPGIKHRSPALQAGSLPLSHRGNPGDILQFSSVQFSRSVVSDSDILTWFPI